MALYDPTLPPYLPPAHYWDDALDQQLQAYATGAPAIAPPPAPVPVLTPEEEAQIEIHQPQLSPEEEAQIEIDPLRLSPEEEAQIQIDPPVAPSQVVMPDYGQPDAISGGADALQQHLEQQVAAAAQPAAGQTSGAPQMPEDYLSDEELGAKWSAMSPEEQLAKRSEIEGGREQLRQAGAIDASTKALKDAESNARSYADAVKHAQTRTAQLDAEAQSLANEKIDPLRDITTGQKILGVIAALASGLATPGGPNIGIEMMDKLINNSLQAQTANLNNRKDLLARKQNAVGEQLALGKDLYQAQETVRLATYDQTIKKLETDVQQYDPRGTRALRMMDTVNALKGARAEALAKYRKDELDRAEKLLKEERERAALNETIRHNKAGEGADATRAYADLLRAKTDKTKVDAEVGADALLTPDELRARGISIPPNANVPPMTLVQAKKLADTAKSVEDWNKAARENSPEELNRQYAVGEILDDNGKAIKFRNPEKVAKTMTATDQIVQLTDRMLTARQKYGWSSDLLKSPEWRQTQADFAQLMLEKKNLDELGVIAGPDMDLMTKAAGTTDPTELRDPTPGLERLRLNTVNKANSLIRYEAPPGTKFKYAPPAPPPEAPKTPQEESLQKVLEFNPKRLKTEESRDLNGGESGPNLAQQDGGVKALPSMYKDTIDRLVASFNDPNASKDELDKARAHLNALQNDARSTLVRDYATKAAQAAAMAAVPRSGPLE